MEKGKDCKIYTPEQLLIVIDILNKAPTYLSRRFILKHLLGWTDEMIQANVKLRTEETSQSKIGDKSWS